MDILDIVNSVVNKNEETKFNNNREQIIEFLNEGKRLEDIAKEFNITTSFLTEKLQVDGIWGRKEIGVEQNINEKNDISNIPEIDINQVLKELNSGMTVYDISKKYTRNRMNRARLSALLQRRLNAIGYFYMEETNSWETSLESKDDITEVDKNNTEGNAEVTEIVKHINEVGSISETAEHFGIKSINIRLMLKGSGYTYDSLFNKWTDKTREELLKLVSYDLKYGHTTFRELENQGINGEKLKSKLSENGLDFEKEYNQEVDFTEKKNDLNFDIEDTDSTNNEVKIIEPYNSIFQTYNQLDWAFDFLLETLNRLEGDAYSQRFSITQPKSKKIVNLNYCDWLVIGFCFLPRSSEMKVRFTLFEDFYRNLNDRNIKVFYRYAGKKIVCCEAPISTFKKYGDELLKQFYNTLTYITDYFKHYTKSRFRFSHQEELLKAIYDKAYRRSLFVVSESNEKVESAVNEVYMQTEKKVEKESPYVIETVVYENINLISVIISADDPVYLLRKNIIRFAQEQAEKTVDKSCKLLTMSDLILSGTEEMPIKIITFEVRESNL